MSDVIGFFHAGITVSDMERSLPFYRDGLGLEPFWDVTRDSDLIRAVVGVPFTTLRNVLLKLPEGGFVELLEYRGVERDGGGPSSASVPGTGHLCLEVRNVDDLVDRLVAHGGSTVSGGPGGGRRRPRREPARLRARPRRLAGRAVPVRLRVQRGSGCRVVTTAAGIGRDDWERGATQRTGAGAVFDPYDRYSELRAAGPVLPGSISSQFGLVDPLHEVFGHLPHFATYDWTSTERVLKDSESFGNAGLAPMNVRQFGPVSLQTSDGVEHRRYRMLMQPAFARRGLAMWERWLVDRLDTLIDAFETEGSTDLYFGYCASFPAHVTAMAFGVPAADVEMFSRWAAMLQIGASTPDVADEASRNVVDYMSDDHLGEATGATGGPDQPPRQQPAAG